jgi:hypothetical protein
VIKVNVVVGNPKAQSRTARIATRLVETLLAPDSYELSVIDLAEHTHRVFDWPSEEMGDADAVLAEWARDARERLSAHLAGALGSLRFDSTADPAV